MSTWDKIRTTLGRFMIGRHGPDEFGLCLIIIGLVADVLDLAFGTGILYMLGMACYIFAIFRMFSRNTMARTAENNRFLAQKNMIRTKCRQFINRRKNSRQYKYFRCPGCRSLMRLTRGTGEKEMTCPKCGRQFRQKA